MKLYNFYIKDRPVYEIAEISRIKLQNFQINNLTVYKIAKLQPHEIIELLDYRPQNL